MSKSIIIAAMDVNNGIGFEGNIPWHSPDDLRQFRKRTENHVVVMGRKTFDSLGKALPNRINVVLTRDLDYDSGDDDVRVDYMSDPKELLERIAKRWPDKDIYIMGGGEVYREFLPHVDELCISHFPNEYETDTTFPTIEPEVWESYSMEVKAPVGESESFVINTYWRRERC